MKGHQLFIPRKTQDPVQQPTYGTDMRAIETAFNAVPTGGGGALGTLLAGAGIKLTPTPGDLNTGSVIVAGTEFAIYTAHVVGKAVSGSGVTHTFSTGTSTTSRGRVAGTWMPLSFANTGIGLKVLITPATTDFYIGVWGTVTYALKHISYSTGHAYITRYYAGRSTLTSTTTGQQLSYFTMPNQTTRNLTVEFGLSVSIADSYPHTTGFWIYNATTTTLMTTHATFSLAVMDMRATLLVIGVPT